MDLSLAMIEHINEELAPIEKELRAYAHSQAGCKALMAHYGVGELTSVALLSELGDTRRFSSSKKAVRYAGMDITVHSSDDRRAAGKLSRQGPPVLRWASIRGGEESLEEELTRSRVLPTEQGTHRGQSGNSIHRAQADPASTSHLTRAGRGGHGRTRAPQ